MASAWAKYSGNIVFLLLLVHVLFYLFPVMLYQSLPTAVAQGTHYTPITITNNANQDITDYSVKIILNATNWDGWNYTSNNGSDIYFLDSIGNPLYYWIEYFSKNEPNYNGSDYITVGIKPSSYGGSPLEVWVYADGTWYKGTNFRVEDNIPKADFRLADIGGKTITRVTLRHSSSTWDDPTDVWIWDSEGNQLYHTTANSHTWDQSFPNYFEYVNVNYQAPEPEIIGYGKAIIWVKVNLTADSDTTIYMYYAGNNPYSNYNDPNEVFIFYEDAESYEEGTLNPDGWSIDDSSGFEEAYVKATSTETEGDISYGSRTIEVGGSQTSGKYENCYVYAGKSLNIDAGTYVLETDIFFRFRDYNGKHHAKIIIDSNTIYDGNPFSGTGVINDWYHLTTTFTLSAEASQIKLGHYFNSLYSGKPIVAFDNIIIGKYVDPEPSVGIGSSEVVGYGVVIEGVSPESVVGGTGDSVSFTVTLNNTLSQDVNVTVKLIDHHNVVRDEISATVPANNTYNVSLTTVFMENDIGDHTWTISVYNASDNRLFDSCSVSVSVFNRTVEITAVNPSSIIGFVGDTVFLNVSMISTLLDNASVRVILIDENNVVRDYADIVIDPNQTVDVVLSTVLNYGDSGSHTWCVRVVDQSNSTYVYSSKDIAINTYKSVYIVDISPSTIIVPPGNTTVFTVELTNNSTSSRNVNVSIIDYGGVIRDRVEVSINGGDNVFVNLSVTFVDDDLGTHIWYINVTGDVLYDTIFVKVYYDQWSVNITVMYYCFNITSVEPTSIITGTGTPFTINVTVKNTGGSSQDTILLKNEQGDIVDSKTVFLEYGETATVSFTSVINVPGEYIWYIETSNDTASVNITILRMYFAIINVEPDPVFTSVNEEFTINVIVKNTGGNGESEVMLVDHNNNVVDSQTIYLGYQESITIQLHGSYSVQGTFTWFVKTVNESYPITIELYGYLPITARYKQAVYIQSDQDYYNAIVSIDVSDLYGFGCFKYSDIRDIIVTDEDGKYLKRRTDPENLVVDVYFDHLRTGTVTIYLYTYFDYPYDFPLQDIFSGTKVTPTNIKKGVTFNGTFTVYMPRLAFKYRLPVVITAYEGDGTYIVRIPFSVTDYYNNGYCRFSDCRDLRLYDVDIETEYGYYIEKGGYGIWAQLPLKNGTNVYYLLMYSNYDIPSRSSPFSISWSYIELFNVTFDTNLEDYTNDFYIRCVGGDCSGCGKAVVDAETSSVYFRPTVYAPYGYYNTVYEDLIGNFTVGNKTIVLVEIHHITWSTGNWEGGLVEAYMGFTGKALDYSRNMPAKTSQTVHSFSWVAYLDGINYEMFDDKNGLRISGEAQDIDSWKLYFRVESTSTQVTFQDSWIYVDNIYLAPYKRFSINKGEPLPQTIIPPTTYEEENNGGNDDNSGGGNTPSSSITITITYPEFNASDLLPPSIGIGEPSLYSPEGIILVAMFIGIFIVFARVFPWGQALTVASILSAIVSILLFKSLTVTGIFMALFMAGLIAWKVLGK